MYGSIKRHFVVFLVLCLAISTTRPALADIGYTKDSKAVGVIAAVVVIGAAAGFGIHYAIRHGQSLKGCVGNSASGLDLATGDGTPWALTGDTQGIKAGERVRINGNRVKGGSRAFAVTKLSKDYGACSLAP